MKRPTSHILIVFVLVAISCKQNNQPSKSHTSRLEFNKNFPDSLLFKIPDSLKAVASLLRAVQKNDQKFRDIEDDSYYVENMKSQDKLDSFNRYIVDSLINIYGILSYKQIGLIGQKGQIFTLIHSGAAYKEKYLMPMKQAKDEKKVFSEYYAMFIDKYLAQKKYMQLFGTQFILYKGETVPYPFEVTQINNNRKRIGLGNIFMTKTSLIKSTIKDSVDCMVLFPEIIKHLKIDTAESKNFRNF